MNEVKRWDVDGDEDALWEVEQADVPFVKYEDYAELKAQRDALAAENAALISGADRAYDEITSIHSSYGWSVSEDGESETAVIDLIGAQFIIEENLLKTKTTATDAYMNSVRADAVQGLADAWYAIANETSEGVSISDSTRLKYRQRADDAADFAAQLRAGEPS